MTAGLCSPRIWILRAISNTSSARSATCLPKERETTMWLDSAMHDIAVLLGGGKVISPDDRDGDPIALARSKAGYACFAVSRVKRAGE